MTPEPVAVPVPVWPVVGSVSVTPSATIVTTAGLTALTMSTTGAWLPPAAVEAGFCADACWAVAVAGVGAGAWVVALMSATVPPDASRDEARTAPTTKTGPTVRFGFGDGAALGALGAAGANGSDTVGAGVCDAAVAQTGAGGFGAPRGRQRWKGLVHRFLLPRRTLACARWSGAQESMVWLVSESRLTESGG